MVVQVKNNEILVRFSAGFSPSKIQSILDYLRYEELTLKSIGSKKDLDSLLKVAKKGRFEKIKKEIGFND